MRKKTLLLGFNSLMQARTPHTLPGSSNSPSRYCSWNILGTPGSHLQLNFSYLSTESLYDRVFIVRPEDCSLIAELSGHVPPARNLSFHINQSSVALYYVVDGSLTYEGFSMSWTSVAPPASHRVPLLAASPSAPVGGVVPQTAASPPAPAVCAQAIRSYILPADGEFVQNCGDDASVYSSEGISISSFGRQEKCPTK